jgi:hypothetical protein
MRTEERQGPMLYPNDFALLQQMEFNRRDLARARGVRCWLRLFDSADR